MLVLLFDGSGQNSSDAEEQASQRSALKLCVCVCRGDKRERLPPSSRTLSSVSHLINVLLHKQQQVAEVTKGETHHLEIFQKDFQIKEHIHIYGHFLKQ